jgi:Tol biopolymer transport system component/tRNA A-37 threonylcarbamoyl transferase component Bud32
MALTAGTRLGPYEIVAALGAGGMGEVYRARDGRLGREVALKILPAALSTDAERLRRFELEARAAGALNHPNVLAIYDIGTQDGPPFLVTELLEGETLRERLQSGALSLRKACEIAIQTARGVAAAHDKGIIHRDLKPANIFLTLDGRVKILDFGLAKLTQQDASATGVTQSATRTALDSGQTEAGMVLGTAGYMSPEQVRGKPADARSDIFALGTVLYEMLSGQRAFEKESSADTMAAILKEEPPELSGEGKKIPQAVDRIVRHCLEKNPAERFQSARDLAFALEAVSESSTAVGERPAGLAATEKKGRWILPASAGVLALAAVMLLAFLYWPQQPRGERLEFSIPLQEESSHLAISPDGRMLAFVSPDEASGARVLRVQRIGSKQAAVLPGTEGSSYPFWSPDDGYVAFFADGKLKKVAASGGVPQALASATSGRGGSWSPRGVIVYSPQADGYLWKVNADGSEAAPLTDKIFDGAKEASHRWPIFLPDGEHFLFFAGNFRNTPDDRFTGIHLGSLAGTEKKLVLLARSNAGYANGYLYYVDEKKALRAIRVDLSKGTTSGESEVVADQVGFQPATYWGAFSVAENGTVVYNATLGATLSVLTWYDRAGKELGPMGDAGVLANPTLSPDNTRVAVDIADAKANSINIWLSELSNGANSRFTFDQTEDAAGIWSRDGAQIAYRSLPDRVHIYLKPAQGLLSGKSIFDLGTNDDIIPNSWTLDDKEILCTLQPATGGSSLVLIPASGGKITPFLATKAIETNGQISPDGKWVAYASNESGNWEIYVTTFPIAAGKWQVSRGGGTEPRWRGDGKEIFYIGAGSTLTAVPISGGGTFSTGNPAPLFKSQLRAQVSSTDLFTYDVTKDGKRFLVNRYAKPQQVAPLHIILNASAELQK